MNDYDAYEFDVYVFTNACTIIKIAGSEYIKQFLAANPYKDEFDAFDAITEIREGLMANSLFTRISAGYALSIEMEAWFVDTVIKFDLVTE